VIIGTDVLRRAAAAGLLGLCRGCGPRESVDAARDRAAASFLKEQIADTKRLIARLESGERITQDRIAIGISEGVVKQIIDASLPPEIVLGNKVRLKLDCLLDSFQPVRHFADDSKFRSLCQRRPNDPPERLKILDDQYPDE